MVARSSGAFPSSNIKRVGASRRGQIAKIEKLHHGQIAVLIERLGGLLLGLICSGIERRQRAADIRI